jgi:hypothetical protein
MSSAGEDRGDEGGRDAGPLIPQFLIITSETPYRESLENRGGDGWEKFMFVEENQVTKK